MSQNSFLSALDGSLPCSQDLWDALLHASQAASDRQKAPSACPVDITHNVLVPNVVDDAQTAAIAITSNGPQQNAEADDEELLLNEASTWQRCKEHACGLCREGRVSNKSHVLL